MKWLKQKMDAQKTKEQISIIKWVKEKDIS